MWMSARPPVWFALDESRPLAFFAGIWTRWTSVLCEGKRIADESLMKLFRAAEALRQEADPIAAAMDKALEGAPALQEKTGFQSEREHVCGRPRALRRCG